MGDGGSRMKTVAEENTRSGQVRVTFQVSYLLTEGCRGKHESRMIPKFLVQPPAMMELLLVEMCKLRESLSDTGQIFSSSEVLSGPLLTL